MKYLNTHQNSSYAIRLERGEPLMATLQAFCAAENIRFGIFHAIGAVLSAEIGFYHLDKKEYAFTQLASPLEIVSLTGNVTIVDDAQFLHAHAVLSDPELRTYGGHLKETIVGATCEIFLTVHATENDITRTLDSDIGLKLWNLDSL